MKYLLDECLSFNTAASLTAMAAGDGSEFQYLLEIASGATPDCDIPEICRTQQFSALITANIKDFGARKVIYRAVLDSGIHVLVLRPGKAALTVHLQVSMLARHYPQFHRIVTAARTATLAIISESGVRERTLEEVLAEMDERGRRPLP